MKTTTPDCAAFEPLLARAAESARVARPAESAGPAGRPLAPADRGRLDAHLASCPSCREALAAQVEVRAILASRPPLDASPAFRVRVRQAIDDHAARTPALADLLDFRRWTWRLVPIAAAMLLAAGVGLFPDVQQAGGADASDEVAQTTAMTADAAELPVSAALYSTNVTDDALLALMLGASADDTLGSVGAGGASGTGSQEPR